MQTARQTLVTWAKQLLCIPDEVETSTSAENKHELYVAPVFDWQIKPPASGDARTSGFEESSYTTPPHHDFAFRLSLFDLVCNDFN